MMDDEERDTLPMLPDHGGPSRRSQTRRSTRRSASMFSPVINFDEGESPSAYEADEDTTFHTGPLRTDPAAPQFVTMSPSLYGGRHRGRSEPSAQPLEEPSERPAIAPKREVGLVRWADERGDYGRRRNDHLDSGSMGMCNDPYCTTCPSKYRAGAASQSKFHRVLPGDAGSWTRKCLRFRNSIFTIMNPHERAVRRWNKFFVISCMVAIFIDPLFFFIFSVKEDSQCMSFDWSFGKTLAVVRSITDFIYFLHMLLQFNLAYVAPETRVVGTGELITDRRKISLHYLSGYFALDLFIVLPLPQVMILFVVPEVGISVANYAKNLLRVTVLLQYIPRLLRVFPLLAGQSESGFIFESAWENFVINLFMFVLSGHVVGSCWYLFGIQRVNKCLKDACILISNLNASYCSRAIDCGHESVDQSPGFSLWQNSSNGSVCLSNGDFNNNSTFFDFGIYRQAPLITKRNSFVTRYVYSLFWGFQQISTLAGNQVPSDFVWEVLFTMGIIGLGLLLFALLIGNMQNFLLALGRRRLEMQLRRRDVEQWMSHRRLPESLRRQVREAERFNWAATRGVDEQGLLVNLPENLQREIRRHLFSFLKTVHIFTLMDEHVLDAICERLRQRLYMCESYIQEKGRPVEKMVFIVRGEIESKEADEKSLLTWGDVCGEELLTWYLEHSSLSKDAGKVKFLGQRLLSERTIKCKQNVEAFILQAADLEYVTIHFARLLQNPRVQGAIRYKSVYWRTLAARRIQVAWRYRMWRLNRKSSVWL